MARRLEGVPAGLLAAARPPGATGRPEDPALRVIREDAHTRMCAPCPLSPGAVAALVPDLPLDVAGAVHKAGGGNPLLVRELLAAVEQGQRGLPQDQGALITDLAAAPLSRMIVDRVTVLGPSAVAIARAVAILGDDATVPAAAELSQLNVQAAEQSVDALVAVDVLAR
jgi:hypothetical protein